MSTYKVEVFDPDQNDYIIHSWHKNRDYAIIQAEVQEIGGKKVRVIHEGKIVYQN